MAEALVVVRRQGERKDIVTTAEYPEPVDLTGMVLTWWQRLLGASTHKIVAGEATFTDISVASGLPEGTLWEHRYTPTAAAVDTPGRYDCGFRQDYGPPESPRYEWVPEPRLGVIRLVVVEQAAT